MSESALNSSVSQSGVIHQTKSIKSMGSQVHFYDTDQPPVRKVKLCTEEKKTALAAVSVRAQISPEKARKAARVFSCFLFLITISIFCIKKNTLTKLLKCLRFLRSTLIMLTYFQIKNDCKT